RRPALRDPGSDRAPGVPARGPHRAGRHRGLRPRPAARAGGGLPLDPQRGARGRPAAAPGRRRGSLARGAHRPGRRGPGRDRRRRHPPAAGLQQERPGRHGRRAGHRPAPRPARQRHRPWQPRARLDLGEGGPGTRPAARRPGRTPRPASHPRWPAASPGSRTPARTAARARRGARRNPRRSRLAPRTGPGARRRGTPGEPVLGRAPACLAGRRRCGRPPRRGRIESTGFPGVKMAWNIPGGSGNNGRPPRKRGNATPLDRLLEPLRGVFGGGNGGGAGIARWAGLLLVLWLVFNCFVLITEQQRGVVLRFGEVARIMQPGPHLKWPWPVERVLKVEATRIKTFSDTVPVLTRDENIVTVEVNVQYRVDDPELYLFGTRNADQVLQQATLSAVREQVGRSELDTVLGARSALSASAREKLQDALREYRTGLIVTELNLPNARPPEEVKPAFDDVNSAQQDKDRARSEAEAYASRIVPEAR